MSRALLVFLSEPLEASLAAVFRGVEVVGPSRVVVVCSKRRCELGEKLAAILREAFGNSIGFDLYCVVPDVETSLEEIPYTVDIVKTVLKGLKDDEVYFVASAGSRLEIASAALALDRGRTGVIYISFYWGPWRGAFYPYTPKPLEIVHELHPLGELGLGQHPLPDVATRLLEAIKPGLTRLRKTVLETQFRLNMLVGETACLATRDGLDCSCKGLRVSLIVNGIPREEIEARDYCMCEDIVEAVSSFCEAIDRLRPTLSRDQYRALQLLARFSGACTLVVEEAWDDRVKGMLLLDALEELDCRAAIDTNIAYYGLHTQAYEKPETVKQRIVMPLCTQLELMTHQAEAHTSYQELRSQIASYALEELMHWSPTLDLYAATTPCEVALALEARGKYAVVTADRHAYKNLFKQLKVDAILATDKPLAETRFRENENSRKCSYAYYALAQLKTLTTKTRNTLQTLGLDLKIEPKR